MNLETLNKHYSFVDGHEEVETPTGTGIESGEEEFIEPSR